MSIKFNEVTWYSKLGAVILVVFIVPTLTFYIGRQYEATNILLNGNNLLIPPKISAENGVGVTNSNLLDDVMNGTYTFDSEKVTLKNGKSLDSDTSITQIFGQPTYADLNNDGKDDAVFFVARQTGGTGTFFYVLAALNKNGKYSPTEEFFIGDRISPQNINVKNGLIMANYAIRRKGSPFTEQPSVGVTKYLLIRDGQLVEK